VTHWLKRQKGDPTWVAFFICDSLERMQKYVSLQKKIGQTPLECMELWRTATNTPLDTPLTYAGRLDPMASGTLLVLVGDECKKKEQYLHLDKEYAFEILFGLSSDTGDVLGRLSHSDPVLFDERAISQTLQTLIGEIELPYPHFSSKTVQGKPLHTWAIEGRLHEIEIPTKTSEIYALKLLSTEAQARSEIYTQATEKIETIAPVTEQRKALGNDFRRKDVRADWATFLHEGNESDLFYIAKVSCIASSGTYMRSLAEVIAAHLDTTGLAYAIHRTKIGTYRKVPIINGIWTKQY